MVKIIFKNVGQGDSIIIEWYEEERKKIGIIDCNLYMSQNPVLNYVNQNKIEVIEFMILSHPHLDHFSGFYDLLNICRNQNILVKRFLHTAQTAPEYLKAATRGVEEDTKLFNLFALLNSMVEKDLLEIYAIDDNPDVKIPIGKEFTMEILAPSSREINNFINGVNYPFDEEKFGNPNANWLSTIFKIYNNKLSILLTSDVESGVLKRIGRKNAGRLGTAKLGLAQIPHHGAKGNLDKFFWQSRKRLSFTPVVISVGKNGYKHPSQSVIDFFQGQSNYEIYRTDTHTIYNETEKSNMISNLLDTFSKVVPEKKISGDVIFNVHDDQINKISS